MEITNYFNQKKDLQNLLLTYIESPCDINDNFELLIQFIQEHEYQTKCEEFEHFLYLLINISNNYFREHDFSDKIQRILLHYEKEIKQTFSNNEIFDIFKSNKQIILFFISKGIITLDKSIINQMQKYSFENHSKFCHFFYPEIKTIIDSENLKVIENDINELGQSIYENFEEKRQKGQNEMFICSLIRDDSVEKFVAYVNQNNISLENTLIKPSIFETNDLLEKNELSLIEYAAFFGSIEIFQYLRLNQVSLPSSLWIYLIHGKNAEMIHLFEEDKIPPNKSFEHCLFEAIKCHHNDIADYILNNFLMNNKNEISIALKAIKYYNYNYFPDNFDNSDVFYSMCKYNYLSVVDLFISNKSDEVKDLDKIHIY